MDPHGIGITADHGRGTVMAMATGITALAGAPHLITIATEEICHQPVIPLISAGKPESRTRKSGHSGNPGARRQLDPQRRGELSRPQPHLRSGCCGGLFRALAATPRGLGSLHSARGLVPGSVGRSALMSGRQPPSRPLTGGLQRVSCACAEGQRRWASATRAGIPRPAPAGNVCRRMAKAEPERRTDG
jgi:hypothetical protein